MTTGTLAEACAHFKLSRLRMRELIDLVDIPAFHPWRMGRKDLHVDWDDALTECSDVLDAVTAVGWNIARHEDLGRYRRVRSITTEPGADHPEEVVLAETRLNGPNATTRRIMRELHGSQAAASRAVDMMAVREGRQPPSRPRVRDVASIEMATFIDQHAPALAKLPATRLDGEFARSRPPADERWLGRAARMSHPETIELTGLFAFVWPTRLSLGSAKGTMTLLERLDQISEGLPLTDPDVIVAGMRRLVAEGMGDTPDTRERFVRAYGWTRNAIVKWLDEVPDDDRARYRRFVPPTLPPDLAGWSRPVTEEEEGEAPASTPREIAAEEVTRRRKEILKAVELRWAEMEAADRKIEAKLAAVRADLAAGRPVDFPVGVPVRHPVVRADGTLGAGRQTTFYEIETAARLWLRCAQASGELSMRRRLSAKERRPLTREREREATGDGPSYDPASETDLKVVLRFTAPAAPGGEHAEPFWAEVLRSGALSKSAPAGQEAAARRDGMRRLLNVGDLHICPGLIVPDDSEALTLMEACAQHLGQVVLPHREFFHAMSMARLCVSAELVSGLRIGETTQSSDSPGRIRWRKIGGQLLYYLLSVPKDGSVLKPRLADKVTMAALKDVRGRISRFGIGADGPLPHTAYQVSERKECLPTGHIVRNATRTVKTIELNLMIAILTCGVVNSTSHPYKYGFTAMLAEAGAAPLMLNAACEHAPGSPVSSAYGRFAEAAEVEKLISSAQADMEADLALWGLME